MCSHVPNKGKKMVRYYGYYSNVSRGRRKKGNQDRMIPFIIEQDENSKEYWKNWARLIQKIYEVDPLICPKSQEKNSSAFSVGVPISCGTSCASKNSVFCYLYVTWIGWVHTSN
jgi:hypothetical protein